VNSKADSLTFPFSTSLLLVLGVFGTSSILVRPREDLIDLRASFGNVLRRGVSAVATFLADRRIDARSSHERFLAKYQRVAVTIPINTTEPTTTEIMIMAPVDKVIDSVSVPDAPAALSPPESLELPTPGASPVPGCCGLALARAEKKLATEAEDMAGVKDVNVVGDGVCVICDRAVVVDEMVVVCPATIILKKPSRHRV